MKKLSIKKETLIALNQEEAAGVAGGLTVTNCSNACKPSCVDCLFSSRQVKPYCWTN